MRVQSIVAVLGLLSLAGVAQAQYFQSGGLVVVTVSDQHVGGSGLVSLVQYTPEGILTDNIVLLPFFGPDVVTLPDITNHDRHLHLSADGRYLALAAYNAPEGENDWSAFPAANAPRAVVLCDAFGNVDVSTKLTDSFQVTTMRSAYTTDGTSIWVAGDNASGATTSGGLRFTTRGSSTSTNLSQVQGMGGARTTDNVRDARAFDGQLYDCSGSNASIGKGFFRVGNGLPTSGAQTLSGAINPDSAASTSSFYFIDADPATPGVDVAYATASAGGEGLHKYVKTGAGFPWTARGIVTFAGIEYITVRQNDDGSASVYVGSPAGIAIYRDADPFHGTISGAIASADFIITPPSGTTLGGFDFSPMVGQPPVCDPDVNQDGNADQGDIDYLVNVVAGGENPTGIDPDFNQDGNVDQGDVDALINVIAGGECP